MSSHHDPYITIQQRQQQEENKKDSSSTIQKKFLVFPRRHNGRKQEVIVVMAGILVLVLVDLLHQYWMDLSANYTTQAVYDEYGSKQVGCLLEQNSSS